MKAISLFSCSGIGELYLKDIGIEVVAANELLERRAQCFRHFFPGVDMISGDIKNPEVKNKIKARITDDVKLLLATPPCQGLSSLGKNKSQKHYELDLRNFLVFDILELIDYGNFDYVLIENVPIFLKMFFPYKGGFQNLEYILRDKYGEEYDINVRIFNAKNYGVPQSRPRGIIRLNKKGLKWNLPVPEKEITMESAIGHLPSLEPGESSDIPLHVAKNINRRYIDALRHTPTGKSALQNETHYPVKENGERINGFHNTFKRMQWDQPCHARTTYCGNVNSHNNVHPGRPKGDGTYTDARPLTPLETYIVSSIPLNLRFPEWASESFMNTMIGEAVPPQLLKKILEPITRKGL